MNRCTVEHCHGQEWFQGEGLCRQHLLEELEQVPMVESTTDLTTEVRKDRDLHYTLDLATSEEEAGEPKGRDLHYTIDLTTDSSISVLANLTGDSVQEIDEEGDPS